MNKLDKQSGMKAGQTLNVVASGEGVGKSFWSEKMNERIRELCIQSGAYEHYEVNEGVNGDDSPMQRFAELIVQECCDVLYDNEMGGYQVNYVLKEHFGVEE